MIGKTLAHYSILAKLGEGGMGEVYRARDTKLDREVAIKILPRDMSGDPERVARFQREARTLASLQHTNIASIYGFEDNAEARFLVMELVEGEDLSERMARGAIPMAESIAIVRQLIEGLETAHERNIVHRDLKPANIKIDPDGVVKILDFGLARAYSGDAESSEDIENSPTITAAMTQVGTILGTAAYMSPEQAKGRPVDRRADIWACGVILWEMLSGKRLFSGDSISDTLAGVLRQEIDETQLPTATPPSLRGLLRKCLERDHRKRLQHIGDARIFLDEDFGAASAVTHGGDAGRWRWVALAFAVLAVVLTGILVASRTETSDEVAPILRRWSFAQEEEGVGSDLVAQVSPDGRSVAYVDGFGLWIRKLEELTPRNIHRADACHQLTWSPDSQWILYGEGDKFFRISPTGGRPHPIGVVSGALSASAGSIAWDEKDRLIIGTGVAGLLHIPILGGDSEVFLPVGEDESDFHQVAALPGAKGWVFIVHDKSGNYSRLDLLTDGGERRTLLDLDSTSIGSIFVDPAGYLVFHRDGSNAGVWAASFDLDRLMVTGSPFLVAPNGENASVSNDGTLVYIQDPSNHEGEIQWLDRSGTLLQGLAEVKTSRPFPYLLPGDAEFVLAVSTERGRDIWTFDATSGLGRQMYQSPRVEETIVANVDGSMLYTYAMGEEGYTIYSFPRRSPSQVEEIVPGILPHVRDDLGFLYYSRLRTGGYACDICEVPLDNLDAEPRVLVENASVNWGAVTSPDGKYMAYSSNESGSSQVYLTVLPEARARWQISADGGHWPRWRTDGREIYYAEGDGIYSASFDAEDGVRLGTPELLFEYPSSRWSNDWPNGFDVDETGERFLVVRRSAATENTAIEVIVVENWAKEFGGK